MRGNSEHAHLRNMPRIYITHTENGEENHRGVCFVLAIKERTQEDSITLSSFNSIIHPDVCDPYLCKDIFIRYSLSPVKAQRL